MSKLVLLDIDGVIVDMLEGIHRVLFEDGITFFPENVETYNFHGDIGCPRIKVFETFSNVKTFEYAPLYPNVVPWLKKLCCCMRVEPYTLVKEQPEIIENRKSLLKSLGLDPIVYTSGTKPYRPDVDFLFEDCLETCAEWLKNGFTGEIFLIDHTYNRDIPEEFSNLDWSHVHRCSTFISACEECLTYGL